MAGEGVRFIGILALGGLDIELIQLKGLEDEIGIALPHCVVDLFQGILGLIPIAEIAHQGDLPGMGGPHPGHHTLPAQMGGLVQAQIFIRPPVGPVAEQVERQVIRLIGAVLFWKLSFTSHYLNAPFLRVNGFFVVIIA